MGSEVAASFAQSKRVDGGRGGERDFVSGGGSHSTVDIEDIGGRGGLSSSSSCVCVLLSTVTMGTGGGGSLPNLHPSSIPSCHPFWYALSMSSCTSSSV